MQPHRCNCSAPSIVVLPYPCFECGTAALRVPRGHVTSCGHVNIGFKELSHFGYTWISWLWAIKSLDCPACYLRSDGSPPPGGVGQAIATWNHSHYMVPWLPCHFQSVWASVDSISIAEVGTTGFAGILIEFLQKCVPKMTQLFKFSIQGGQTLQRQSSYNDPSSGTDVQGPPCTWDRFWGWVPYILDSDIWLKKVEHPSNI